MKQLLPLFLFLLPCLALAQYPSNGNQKITLGEQTTADGLIFRGVASTDTVRKPSIDTMTYMVLDTTTNIIWHYKKATSNAWLRVGGSISSGLTGVLPVANGGTGSATQNFVDLTTTQSIGGAKTLTSALTGTSATFSSTIFGNAPLNNTVITTTDATNITNGFNLLGSQSYWGIRTAQSGNFNLDVYGAGATKNALSIAQSTGAATFSSSVTATRFDPTSSSASGDGLFLPSTNILGFSTNGTEKMRIASNGRVGIGTSTLTGILNIKQSGAELSIQTDVNNVYFEGINRDNTALNVDYGFYARNGAHKFWTGTYTERMRLTNDGELWIGYTSDNGAYPLQVNGQIFATSATIATPSDISYKENIQPLDKGLEIINKLKPKKFNFISTTLNNFSEFEEVGFIAQDVEGALSTELFAKSIVKKSDESKEDSTLVLMTQNLIPILTKAIQEQQALIKALEQRIINLENK
jgi:hypothetical protein